MRGELMSSALPFLWEFRDSTNEEKTGHYIVGSYHLLDTDYHDALMDLIKKTDVLALEHDTTKFMETEDAKSGLVKDFLSDAEIERVHALLRELRVPEFTINDWPLQQITSAIRVLLYREIGARYRMEERALELAIENDRRIVYLEPTERIETIDAEVYADYLRGLGPLETVVKRLRNAMDDYYSGDLTKALGGFEDEDAALNAALELVEKRDPPMAEALLCLLTGSNNQESGSQPPIHSDHNDGNRSSTMKTVEHPVSVLVMVGLTHCMYLQYRLEQADYSLRRLQ